MSNDRRSAHNDLIQMALDSAALDYARPYANLSDAQALAGERLAFAARTFVLAVDGDPTNWPIGWNTDLDKLSIDNLLALMAVHTAKNPTHGHNCACKDAFLSAVRKRIGYAGDGKSNPMRAEFAYLAFTLTR